MTMGMSIDIPENTEMGSPGSNASIQSLSARNEARRTPRAVEDYSEVKSRQLDLDLSRPNRDVNLISSGLEQGTGGGGGGGHQSDTGATCCSDGSGSSNDGNGSGNHSSDSVLEEEAYSLAEDNPLVRYVL